MAAGDSAAAEAQRQRALADAHAREVLTARATSQRYELAARTERATAAALAPLAAAGFHLLADRAWPGSRRAQLDMVVVGPSGVHIIDTKAWSEVTITGARVFRGQEDVTDELLRIADLAHTTAGDLADIGLAPGEVHAVIVLAGRRGIHERVGPLEIVGEHDVARHIARHSRLTPHQVDTVLAHVLTIFPVAAGPAPVAARVPEPVLPAPQHTAPQPPQPHHHHTRQHPAPTLTPDLQATLLEALVSAPVEEWMTFLHPDQARLVRRSFNGPCRIRGAAGTGKTVVGLHRAAFLARTRPGKVLVTSFVRTLPVALEGLFARLAPDVADRVEFLGVHRLARRILDERGIDVHVAPVQVDNHWARAWNDNGRGTLLDTDRVPRDYWRDEILHVIKARGITTWDGYASLERTGRRHPLGPDQRRAVWDLYVDYTRRLRDDGIHDFHDIVLLAAAELEREPLDRYGSVIVDEAQDLSAVAVRMLHGLVGDRRDGLTLIGDGQQSIYVGGYTLAELGISVSGRAVVLDTNYRNTQQILEFARRMVDGDEVADIETSGGVLRPGDIARSAGRSGPTPVIERFATERARLDAVVARVAAVTREVGTRPGDVAVLCVGTRAAEAAAHRLTRAGHAVQKLSDYDGQASDAVKVGTIKRAKGLEFKQVILADLRDAWLTLGSIPALDENAGTSPSGAVLEQRTLLRRELYVAMTRARDGLWLGLRP